MPKITATATRTILRMTTAGPEAASLLQLLWLASPALPVGSFSYSEGLEAAVDAGLVSDEASAATWLSDQLWLSQARADLAVVADGIQAWRRDDLPALRALDDWVLQTRETSELRLQTEQMGRSMLALLRNHDGIPAARLQACAAWSPTWPLAQALALSAADAPVRQALLSYAFGWAEAMVQAAIKAVPLGQSAVQRVLARLVQGIPAAVEQALACPAAERQAFSPMLAILSARHETQYSRLFRS